MSVAAQKIDGVNSVDVSLNDGLAVVMFSPDNRAPVAEIRKAIRDNGFSPKGADVRIAGVVTHTEGGVFLRIPDGGRRFRLEGQSGALSNLTDQQVVVEGEIPESDADADESGSLIVVVRTVRAAGRA